MPEWQIDAAWRTKVLFFRGVRGRKKETFIYRKSSPVITPGLTNSRIPICLEEEEEEEEERGSFFACLKERKDLVFCPKLKSHMSRHRHVNHMMDEYYEEEEEEEEEGLRKALS